MTDATIRLWGTDIGAVSWVEDRGHAVFQYMPGFLGSGVELAPLAMPLNAVYYSDQTVSTRIRCFIDFLSEKLNSSSP